MPETERRLAAIMFTDIVGYTALMGESEAAGMRVRERHRDLLGSLAGKHHGRIADENGDELVLVFASALDAVTCALSVQRKLADDADLKLRIGIHSGDVVFEGERIYGDGVNVASRIRPLAEARGVCVSGSVYDSIKNHPGIECTSLGQQDLKNVDRPVSVFAVSASGAASAVRVMPPVSATGRSRAVRWALPTAAALLVIALLGWWLGRSASVVGPIRSIAVLPLENLSGDPGQEFFADGMTEALIADLAKIRSLRVISRTSVMPYKQTDLSAPEIAAELGVEGLIEGSVLRAGDQVRIIAQLIHGPSDTHLWSESYTRPLTNVIQLQSEVALAIAGEVRAAITPEEASRIATPREVVPEAYTEWLKGRHFRSLHSAEGFRQAVAHFERAVALDPGFAAAHADLGMAYREASSWGWKDPGEDIERARELIRTALRLDPDNSDAHAAAGYVALGYDHDWSKAEAELRRALELDPNNAPASKFLVYRLAIARHFDEAIEVGRQAVELDPLNPYALDALADAYSAAGQHERSIALRRQTLELVPNHQGTLLDLALSYLAIGQPEEALRVREQLDALRGEPGRAWLAVIYAQLGRSDEARALLAQTSQSDLPLSAVLAWAHFSLGEKESAIDALEEGYRRREWVLIMLNTGYFPFLESLADEPRYQDLLRRINFPR